MLKMAFNVKNITILMVVNSIEIMCTRDQFVDFSGHNFFAAGVQMENKDEKIHISRWEELRRRVEGTYEGGYENNQSLVIEYL